MSSTTNSLVITLPKENLDGGTTTTTDEPEVPVATTTTTEAPDRTETPDRGGQGNLQDVCTDGNMDRSNPCSPRLCFGGKWMTTKVNNFCDRDVMGDDSCDGEWVPASEGKCCDTCKETAPVDTPTVAGTTTTTMEPETAATTTTTEGPSRGDQGNLGGDPTTTTTMEPETAATTTTTDGPDRGGQGNLGGDSTTTTTMEPETVATTTTTDGPDRGDQGNLEDTTIIVDTTDGYNHLHGQSCFDYPSYRDPRGFSCSDWADLNCNIATNLGYSDFHQNEISQHCRKSCGHCAVNEPPPTCQGRDSASYTTLNLASSSPYPMLVPVSAGSTCSDWAGQQCLTETTSQGFTTRAARKLFESCPNACGLCACEDGHDCRPAGSDGATPIDDGTCASIKCGALCAKADGCGWSSDESKCVRGGFTSDDEFASGDCPPQHGNCFWFVLEGSSDPCSCSTAACSACRFDDYVEECLECGAGAYLESVRTLVVVGKSTEYVEGKKCVSECSSDRVAVGSTNAQRVCSEPFTCSAGHVDDGVRELGWGYRSPPHARADAECSCSSNCSACTVDKAGSHCSLCADGFEIFQGTCVAECPSDTDKIVLRKSGSPGTLCWPREYCHHGNQIEGGVCQCPAGCVECRGSLCRRCEDGYTFLDGFCVAEERCPASLPAATIMTRHGEASFSECKPKLTKEEKAAAKAAAKADAKA